MKPLTNSKVALISDQEYEENILREERAMLKKIYKRDLDKYLEKDLDNHTTAKFNTDYVYDGKKKRYVPKNNTNKSKKSKDQSDSELFEEEEDKQSDFLNKMQNKYNNRKGLSTSTPPQKKDLDIPSMFSSKPKQNKVVKTMFKTVGEDKKVQEVI